MKKKIIPIVCFLLTLVLCVAAYATVSSVRHREKNDTDNSKRDNFYEVIFKKKVSITKTDFKKRIKDIFMTFTLWNSDQKLRESYREVLFWGRMECLT